MRQISKYISIVILLVCFAPKCFTLNISNYNKAMLFKAQFKIDSAEYYFNASYNQAISKKENILAINSLLSLADMYYDFRTRSLVMAQLEKVKSLAQKNNLLQSEEYAHYCDLMGKIYLDANAPDFSLASFQQSLNIRKKLYSVNDIRLIRSYVNFLTYYYILWDVENQLKYIDIVTSILSKNTESLSLIDIPEVYNALARSIKTNTCDENRFEKYKITRQYLADGISFLKKKTPVNYYKLGQLYHTMANTYVDDIPVSFKKIEQKRAFPFKKATIFL